MKTFLDDIKNSTNTKLLFSIFIISVLIFFKTCSLKNHKSDIESIKKHNDSLTTIIYENISNLNNQLVKVEGSQVDLISYTLYKDEVSKRDEVISDLKKRLIILKNNENK